MRLSLNIHHQYYHEPAAARMNLLEVAVLLVVLLGVVLLHGCILLGLGSWEDVVSSLWRRKTPPRTVASAPAGSGKRAKRTQRKKVLRQWRKSVDENEAQSLQPEMKLDRPCERLAMHCAP